jgi:hypothetical protein
MVASAWWWTRQRPPDTHVPPPAVAAPPPAPVAPTPAAAPVAAPLSPCPPEMALVDAEVGFCIDIYEAPGRGQLPVTGVGHAEAVAACEGLGKRLCTAEEWEAACRGERRASYPWGNGPSFAHCNLSGGKLAASGERAACRSASGAFDMSGNASEWVLSGQARGSSASDGGDGRCSRKQKPASARADLGYRCCADPVATK